MSKLYVGNVPEGAKDKELQELFEAFGEVEEVAMLRGYGFVHFVKAEDASAALNALDDSEFLGSHIQVQVKLGGSRIL
jgi:RNA recognition motif-containing protein